MATKPKKKNSAARSNRPDTGLRGDVQEAIDRVFPGGLVEMTMDPDESYFFEHHAKLSRAFRRIPNTSLVCEREAQDGTFWLEDPEDESSNEIPVSRSYHTFFISPDDKEFTYKTETESLPGQELMGEDLGDDDVDDEDFDNDDFDDEDWEVESPEGPISGTGRTGLVVAVSLLAPFAVIELSDTERWGDGATKEPSIESYGQTADGKSIDREKSFREAHGDQAYQTIVKPRAKIAEILEQSGIAVLPAEEWRKPVPGLRACEEIVLPHFGKSIRVLDAFFFESF